MQHMVYLRFGFRGASYQPAFWGFFGTLTFVIIQLQGQFPHAFSKQLGGR